MDKDTDPVPLEKLTEKINVFLGPLEKREPGKNRVIIRGDGTASYQTVIKVIDKVNEAGVSKFNLAMVRQTGSGEK
ncbi:transport energizing protein, ExbD/TolR domain protein [Leptospira interrogans serovar Copenhageni str. LT2050]|uniref:Transport energizing protein, ExbD/TolR domain protein n=1 Tax=Leptospira interrogans serovar Copenhageni str. LT2050 TaxID=1001598 RepID=M3ISR6_LEPIT|nr:transport energizing protein, ExbD/TolR domain protein [Leptospira interrogans serovar Copenhageni str. LT2050]